MLPAAVPTTPGVMRLLAKNGFQIEASRKSLKKKTASSQSDLAALRNRCVSFSAMKLARTTKTSVKIKVGRCGKAEEHNAAKCPNRSKGSFDTDVLPGNYVVGECPIELLQRRNTFTSIPVQNPEIIDEYNF
ncbi:hypothetical protein GQ600_17538 [Phytophthora cactorum]|nr:hypothetical protein GQ600_17538 [Phytophthora cactorum]